MATYRPVYIGFWQDDDVLEFTPEEKFFFLYIMTNSKTTQSGIYQFSKKVAAFETGYNIDTVTKYLNVFIEKDKIAYDKDTDEIMILKWLKYNPIDNKNILKCVNKELLLVKSIPLLRLFKEKVVEFVKKEDCIPTIDRLEQVVIKSLPSPLEAPCKPLRSPLEVPTKEESESKTETESKTKSKAESESKGDADADSATFDKYADADSALTVKDVFEFFEDNFYLPKSFDVQVMISWCEHYPIVIILEAMKEAKKYNARTLNYIEQILISWTNEGITTIQALESYKNAKANKGVKSDGSSKRDIDADGASDKYSGVGFSL